jgi:hypothetical protein
MKLLQLVGSINVEFRNIPERHIIALFGMLPSMSVMS